LSGSCEALQQQIRKLKELHKQLPQHIKVKDLPDYVQLTAKLKKT